MMSPRDDDSRADEKFRPIRDKIEVNLITGLRWMRLISQSLAYVIEHYQGN